MCVTFFLRRMKVQGVVLTRLGCSEAAELVAWETVLGRCLSGEGPSPLLGLERLTLMQLAAASPLQLDSTLEIPSGAFLLQPRSFDGGFKEYRNGRRCMHVVWLPPPSLSLLLLPGEADRVRVLNLEIIQHSNLAYRRSDRGRIPRGAGFAAVFEGHLAFAVGSKLPRLQACLQRPPVMLVRTALLASLRTRSR